MDRSRQGRKFKTGGWVQVRSKEEILRTLDSNGQLDGMPFMPEMFAYCGTRFQVYKRAHKTCDTVFPVRGRRVARAVHLETRCSGDGHGGCQAGCLLFWKEAWLQPVDPADSRLVQQIGNASAPPGSAPSPMSGKTRWSRPRMSRRCTPARLRGSPTIQAVFPGGTCASTWKITLRVM